ncbi:MAG: carboxypeptidase-like regulatory domain-containing protein, partial [Arcicella sp.]|nr:carboxypeptidase-like regulatory domain-containing protein [Arcicella sp.]
MIKQLIVTLLWMSLVNSISEAKMLDLKSNIERKSEDGVTGKVTDNKGAGIAGVSVIIKGTNKGTITDNSGNFQIPSADGNSVLVFSSVGFISQTVKVANQKTINISLAANDKELDEI